MTESKQTKIGIADPQFLTGFAIENILKTNYSIVFWHDNFTDLKLSVEKNNIDLLIIDPSLPGLADALEIAHISANIKHILIITDTIDKSDITELSTAGIQSIIMKSTDRSGLIHAVEQCLKGKSYFSEEILQLLLETREIKNHSLSYAQLTSAEMEIVKLIAEGLTTKEIAARKFISFHTVITHRKNIFRKTGVNSVSELIIYSIKAGWIDNIEYYI